MSASIIHDLVTGHAMMAMLLEMLTAPGLLPIFRTMEPLVALGATGKAPGHFAPGCGRMAA